VAYTTWKNTLGIANNPSNGQLRRKGHVLPCNRPKRLEVHRHGEARADVGIIHVESRKPGAANVVDDRALHAHQGTRDAARENARVVL